jgi:hypothetical protein
VVLQDKELAISAPATRSNCKRWKTNLQQTRRILYYSSGIDKLPSSHSAAFEGSKMCRPRPTLAPPAQGLVVGVIVVGIRHCSASTESSGSSSASMAKLLLLLLQLLRRYGHLHRLAVAARPAPPLTARRPRPYHPSHPINALLLQEGRSMELKIRNSLRQMAEHCDACTAWLFALTSAKEAVAWTVALAEVRRRASSRENR